MSVYSSQFSPYPPQWPSAVSSKDASNVYLYELATIRPDWHAPAQLASPSVAKVTTGHGDHLGCGILIGIDRILVPAHILSQTCTDNLRIEFDMSDERYCFSQSFNVLQAHDFHPELDFCILQVARANSGHCAGYYPGQKISIPGFSFQQHHDEFLLVHTDGKGSQIVSIGAQRQCSDWGGQLCSYSATVQGSSGGGYFDKSGALIAMHLHRSTGFCGGSNQERKAIFIADIIRHSSILSSSLSICQPLREPSRATDCFPNIPEANECYINEGRPAVHGAIHYQGVKCGFWEQRPKNCNGEGPRGIKIALPTRGTVYYDFDPNPHSFKKYIKQGRELYENAATVFFDRYANYQRPVDTFRFAAYGEVFTASITLID